jgi:uncharacterized protein (TIGR03663 family)
MEATPTIRQKQPQKTESWLDRPLSSLISLDWEMVIFLVLIVLAIGSRFYNLQARVMSHDETSHVYWSWLFEQGRGYTHDPVTHGPLQFHLVALSYFIFGDNDFTARIPAALFSIATVVFMWNYRRYLGKAGALIGAALLLISPYMLYYGRYVRNEAFVAFFGVVTLWAMLRYLELGLPRYLYILVGITALHFATKETSFIYTAQALIFLGLYLVARLMRREWPNPAYRRPFLTAFIVGGLLLTAAVGVHFGFPAAAEPSAGETVTAVTPEQAAPTGNGLASSLPIILLAIGVLALAAMVYFMVRGYTWGNLAHERSFGLLVVLGTMVLPMLASFPVRFLGFNPTDYNNPQTITTTAIFVAILALLAMGLGLSWNSRRWLISAGIFYAIFTVLYTTIFTNGFGFVTGLVGSLGYWLEQQSVNRGNQPWYYYGLIQIPVYEYLPALGSIAAFIYGLRVWRKSDLGQASEALEKEQEPEESERIDRQGDLVVFSLFGFWSVTSLIAYSLAGEKMPWLTVHIALPLILWTAWYLGHLVENTDWKTFFNRRGLLVIVLLPMFFLSMMGAMTTLLGPTPPFQGKELDQLRTTTTFITSILFAAGSAWAISYLARNWSSAMLTRVVVLGLFGILSVLTVRTAIMAAYINYNNATEFLVYAHMGPGPKRALKQIEEISLRTTDGLGLRVAYDDQTSYPFWWYLRDFTNTDSFGANPTRAQRDAAAILVGQENYTKIEPVVGQAYYQFDYVRIWWPTQEYFGLTWDRIRNAITDPQMRAALFQIWLNRDYSLYGEITDQDFSLPNWQPSQKMRLYLRKDIVSQLWNYGSIISEGEVVADPYEGKKIDITADRTFGSEGSGEAQFQRPRDLVVAPDGSIFVADAGNHRIQHLDGDGNFINQWGGFGDINAGNAPGGTFNEPWGIAQGPDGSIYVADTWNHRIQKFTPQGEFLSAWGFFGQGESISALWGPRDIEVDDQGRVFVSDTGNKRIVVFDSEGNPLTEFGEEGLQPGQFDEPVGLALDNQNHLFVADTWNQRIQVLSYDADSNLSVLNNWEIVGWYGQSLDNKPYLSVDNQDHLFATDPEGYRVLVFTTEGDFLGYWGDFSIGPDGFGLVGSVAVDPTGGVWVSDTGNNRLMHFTINQSDLTPGNTTGGQGQ